MQLNQKHKSRVGSIPLKRVIKNIEDFLNLKEKGGYKLPVVGVSFAKLKKMKTSR